MCPRANENYLRTEHAVKFYFDSTLSDWLVFSSLFQFYRGGLCTYQCFHGIILTGTSHNILSKPLAAFPLNHHRNNGLGWQRNESCCNDYYQSSEMIGLLAEPGIEPATFCSQVLYGTDYVLVWTNPNWRTRTHTSKLPLNLLPDDKIQDWSKLK